MQNEKIAEFTCTADNVSVLEVMKWEDGLIEVHNSFNNEGISVILSTSDRIALAYILLENVND